MKKVFHLLFVLILSVFVFPIIAQEESSFSETMLSNTVRDNWYVSIGPSINLMFGEQDLLVSPHKRLKLGGGFSVGKWFNPNTGISFNVMGGGLRGFNMKNYIFPGYYSYGQGNHGREIPMGGDFYDIDDEWNPKYKKATGKKGEGGFWQDFNYGVATIDLMGNLTNLFRGHEIENSRFDLAGFVGLGANYVLDNGSTTPKFYWLAARTGVRANFNLTKKLGIYVEPVVYFTDGEFDGYKGTTIGDLYANLSFGVQYTFNKRISSFEKITIDELDRLNRRVNENRDLIENHQDILERQQRLIDKLSNTLSTQAEKSVPVVHKGTPGYIRFALNSSHIERSEYSKLQDAADFLKSKPDSKLLLIGYADRLTGTSTYNYILSKKRVETVKSELQRLGVSNSCLSIEWKGDKEQPFTTNEWNRVVIMVERR